MSSPPEFKLPDLVSLCPFPFSSNPHYDKLGTESAAWIDSFKFLRGRKRDIYIESKPELLASRVYPYAGYEEFRTSCDIIQAIFVLDETSDDRTGADSRSTGNVFLAALGGRPCDKSALTRMTQEFNSKFCEKASKKCQERLVTYFTNYINALNREAELRDAGKLIDWDAFMSDRRENSGIRPCFGLIEYIYGIDLPDEVFDDAVFTRLYWAAADIICLTNDVYSYRLEVARGVPGNNSITILMKSKGQSLQEAVDYVGRWIKSLLDQYLADKAKLPSFGALVDEAVQKYIFGMENWIIGNIIWCLETPRYFGPDFQEVKKTLVVKLQAPETE